MASHMQDQNTFLLKPLIVSASKHRTSSECPENGRPNGTDRSEETTELRLKRFICSGSKVPDELMKEVVAKCKEQEDYAEILANSVFNSDLVVSNHIRYQSQTSLLKSLTSELEKNGVVVPDSMFDRLGTLMGMKDEEYVERLYLDETGEKVLAKFSESVNQLSMGTTGLSVWQASCDLSNLFRLVPKNIKRIVELGSGCGVSGISIAKSHGCQVVLTDCDDNVLELLEKNAVANGLTTGENPGKVRCLDWCDFELTDWKEPAELIIAADVVYDTALLASLCSVLRLLLREARAAIVACTRRNVSSLSCFEHHLKMSKLEVVEQIEYENGAYYFDGETFYPHPTIFPFHSTLKTPTIFYNIQPKK